MDKSMHYQEKGVKNVFILQRKYNSSVYKHLRNLKSCSSGFSNPIHITTGIARNTSEKKKQTL
jgi:hypothetical protein